LWVKAKTPATVDDLPVVAAATNCRHLEYFAARSAVESYSGLYGLGDSQRDALAKASYSGMSLAWGAAGSGHKTTPG
jgi:hypothetical protein